jgi:NAD(P)-dependent dehydrogenase (short-subunit alcohol dehydrogenase family)
MPGALENRSIVVIGGTTGLGLSAAKAFIAAGAKVTVAGRNPDSLSAAVSELGNNAVGVNGDASDPEVAPAAIEVALQKFGDFHGLYHVAGGSGRKQGDGPLHEVSEEGWDYTLRLNLKSVFLSNRAALQHWQKSRAPGVILNMASVLGYSPAPNYFATHAYSAAKAAIIGLSRSAAAYYAKQNIRINVIAPALVDTPMAQRAVTNKDILRYLKTKQPLDGGRAGIPADLDAMAILLMSDQSSFMTGQVISVDGGWSVSEGQYF